MEKSKENIYFLQNQLITYLGNKRSLIKHIEKEIQIIQNYLKTSKTINVDLFSGSGVVARMMKKYSSTLIVNDLENYSFAINSCYLSNKKDFDINIYEAEKKKILNFVYNNKIEGIISNNYAPKITNKIKKGERAFYTRENALFIDSVRSAIDEVVTEKYKKFFIGPLLVEASIKNNTAGIFKGFYKDKKTGIGKYGGTGQYALSRIKSNIELKPPILSEFNTKIKIFKEDSNKLAKNIGKVDIVYLDPPYNQHPYGSNYFMLNIILENKINSEISKISGIPKNWNRSNYNKKNLVLKEFEKLLNDLNAKFIIISYNSEGFMKLSEIERICKKMGNVNVKEIPYNTFKGSRNLSERNLYVEEYLIILEKKVI